MGYLNKRCDITGPEMAVTPLPIIPEANLWKPAPFARFVGNALIALDKVTIPGQPG